jgi:hypothetical protein
MYKRRFLRLSEAVSIIARTLADTDPEKYKDDTATLEDTKYQLVQALFEGAIASEGVWWEVLPPYEDEFPVTRPDEWTAISRGWWSHKRYEKRRPTAVDLSDFFAQEASPEGQASSTTTSDFSAENCGSSENQQRIPDDEIYYYYLDKIAIDWDHDGFSIEEDWGDPRGCHSIRVSSEDIEVNFSANPVPTRVALATNAQDPKPPSPTGAVARIAPAKKRTKRPIVRDAVFKFMDEMREKHSAVSIANSTNGELAEEYFKQPIHIGDFETVRKLIGRWKRMSLRAK